MDGGTPQRARTEATRQALLTASRELFTGQGYAGTGVDEIVERSGASIGSLYHHFGGKAGLFSELWEHYVAAKEDASRATARAARDSGETGPLALFLAGARGYLDVCWEQRDLALLFLEREGPEGFALQRRRRGRTWVRRNIRLFPAEKNPLTRQMLVIILTTSIGEAGREVACAPDRRTAEAIIDETCHLLNRLSRG